MTSHLGASGCGGPVAPIEFAILSTLFLLREVEAASSMISAWHLHREAMELTWHLPASKSDHMALWTRRTWGCLCGMPSFACPFHVAAAHNDTLRASAFFRPGLDTPFFPTRARGVATKLAVVGTFEAIGTAAGMTLLGPTALRLFGGHTPRVTGAQVLSALGIEVSRFRNFACWHGIQAKLFCATPRMPL